MEIDTIIAGDCAVLMAQLPDACIDLVVTSPPYDNLRKYKGFEWDFAAVSAQLWRVIKPGGVVVWVVADQTIKGSETGTSFRQALAFMALGFRLHQRLFYEKGGPHPDPTRYEETVEEMFVFSKGQPKTINLLKDKRKAEVLALRAQLEAVRVVVDALIYFDDFGYPWVSDNRETWQAAAAWLGQEEVGK